jgi:hypothetical protein
MACTEVKHPIEILEGELDGASPPALVHQFEQTLDQNKGVCSYFLLFIFISGLLTAQLPPCIRSPSKFIKFRLNLK